MAISAEFKTKWVKALRSGEFEQCTGSLKKDDRHCCLGVACVVLGWDIPEGNQQPLYDALEDIGVDTTEFYQMNDGENASFVQIADHIEAQP